MPRTLDSSDKWRHYTICMAPYQEEMPPAPFKSKETSAQWAQTINTYMQKYDILMALNLSDAHGCFREFRQAV